MQYLQPLFNSIFNPPVSKLDASVSSAIASIGFPGSRDYCTKINDWLSARGLPPKPNKCNLPVVLNNIQNILNGISRKEPDSVLPLDISKAIQNRLKAWNVVQKDALFDAKNIKYSWVITAKNANVCMSIHVPENNSCGLYGGFRDKKADNVLSEINFLLTQMTSLCNLMDNELINPDYVLSAEMEMPSVGVNKFIAQTHAIIKNKMEELEEIKQNCIQLCKNLKREAQSTTDLSEQLGFITESSFLQTKADEIEEEKSILSIDINKLYHKFQQHGFEIHDESFFPEKPISDFLRMKKDFFSSRDFSGEKLIQQIEEHIVNIR